MHDSLFQRLRDDASPSTETKDRIRASMQARIGESAVFAKAKASATPSDTARSAVWNRVRQSIESPAESLIERVGSWLTPSQEFTSMLRGNILARLEPVRIPVSYSRTKWVAAFALIALAIRVSPVLFLAPRTIADSKVLLIPTTGSVEISLKGLWQPVSDELTLNQSVAMRSNGGQATVLLHDDGTIRLDADASINLYDLSDRPEPALDSATLALGSGRIWIQGLIPAYVRGLTVTTPYGDVIVHDGSVSIAIEDNQLNVQVWDHSASIRQGDRVTSLVTGEQARIRSADAVGIVTHMPESAYDEAWVTQNLERDAVHQREVSQMQRERSAAEAGILPNSPLYSVKRVVEQVDVLLTLDPAAKLQKQIDLASTRLNEAVALIAEGSTGATVQMEEYRQALKDIATGSGSEGAAQFLLRQEVAENAAGLSAAQPNDPLYALKKAVLEASADLPVDVVNDSQVQSILLVDTLDALNKAVASGDTAAAQASYAAATPYLPLLQSGSATSPEVRKEAFALLSQAAVQLQAGDNSSGSSISDLASDLEPFLPVVAPAEPAVQHLSDDDVAIAASRIIGRINHFTQPRPRQNQLTYEIKQLDHSPDAGRILRQLYHILPDDEDGLKLTTRRAIQNLREEQ